MGPLRRILLLCVAVCAVSAEITFAETSFDESLEEIVVEASTLNQTIIPVQTLEGSKLKNLSSSSVADAVRYFSGVQIKDYGGIGGLKTIDVRSMGSHHVGVFYDGVEISNAQNGVVDLGRFTLDNMESISVFNGQKSSIFQSAADFASSSALYLQTRIPKFEQGRSFNLDAGFKAGSFDTYNPTVLWEQRLSSKVSMSLSAEYLYTSGKYKFRTARKDGYDTIQTRKNGDVNSIRAELGLYGQLDNSGNWSAKAYYYNSRRGYPGAVVRTEPGKFQHQDRQWDRNFFLQGQAVKQFSTWYSFQGKLKFSNDFLHYLNDPNQDISTMYIDNSYLQRQYYASVANLFEPFDWWKLSLSADCTYSTLWSDMNQFANPNRLTFLANAAWAFLWWKVKLQANLLYTFVKDRTDEGFAQASDKNRFSPSVTISYRPFDNVDLTLRAYYKDIFRMPTLNDLYYTFIGNVNLKPETTRQFNLGAVYCADFYSGVFRHLQLTADAYYNQVDNKIIAMPGSNQFRWSMTNIGNVRIKGVDANMSADWLFGNVNVNTGFSYTYQKAQDFTDKSSPWYGGQIPYIPLHSLSVLVGADWKDFGLNYSFVYTGERYESVANIPENYAQPWYTHDVSMYYNWSLEKCSLRFAADVNNIFNQQYEVVQCYPMPGTNFKIKLNIML